MASVLVNDSKMVQSLLSYVLQIAVSFVAWLEFVNFYLYYTASKVCVLNVSEQNLLCVFTFYKTHWYFIWQFYCKVITRDVKTAFFHIRILSIEYFIV